MGKQLGRQQLISVNSSGNMEETGEVMTLPDLGITGNSHMMMMEYNNYEIADLMRGVADRAWSDSGAVEKW